MFKFLHHLFVPSHRNNFRARALHLDVLTVFVLVFTAISFTIARPSILGIATDVNIQRLIDRTNEERSKNGLGPLTYNDKLASAAQQKAQHMIANNYWDHFAPDGTSPWDFISGAGYAYKYAGENLAYNFMFSDDVVNAWMDSPTHRANIVRSEYSEIGFAVMNGNLKGEDTTLVVQMFGTPQGSNIVPVAQAKEEVAEVQKPQPTRAPTKPSIAPTSAEVAAKADEADTTEEPLTETAIANNPLIQPVSAAENQSSNLPAITFNSSTLIISLLLLVLLMDLIIAYRLKLVRVTGKNLAHIIFLGAILVGVYIVKAGDIL